MKEESQHITNGPEKDSQGLYKGDQPMNANTITCSDADCTNLGAMKELGLVTIPLCQEHVWDLAAYNRTRARKMARDIYAVNPTAKHVDGWTYIIRLVNGNVKIGTTANPSLKRLKDITSRDNQGVPVQVIAVMKGGASLEAIAQEEWIHLRVPGHMEEFYADPTLLRWAEKLGIHPDVASLDDWLLNKHNRRDMHEVSRAMKDHIGIDPMPFREWTAREAEFLTNKMEDR
ncbi:hypothetical protein [Streptomyces sp. NBC_01428]|uniref:hypothetical protein n=1 Tax=Streptomyces sp. NBC_01428 TaxID=2903861 RepID=UPI002E30EF40|nr:hypothetical protein [Streptomyces sp. NBC_01428]